MHNKESVAKVTLFYCTSKSASGRLFSLRGSLVYLESVFGELLGQVGEAGVNHVANRA